MRKPDFLVRCLLLCSMLPCAAIDALAQFSGPDITLCDPCPFPLVADVDANGSPDLIFTSPELENITWRANDGSGNFGPDQFLAINQRHLTFRLAVDADADQDIDLIGVTLAPFTDSLVAILRNEDGFYVLDTIDHPMSGPRTLEQVADLDGDGRPDLLSLDNGASDVWYRDNGDGSWARRLIPHWCLPVGGPYVVLDAEGDGDLDLARYVMDDNRLVVVWNLGGGRFGPWTWATGTLPSVGGEPGAGKHDVNSDGFDDLVLGGLALISYGNGTFAPQAGLTLQYDHQSIANVNCEPAAEAVLSWSTAPVLVIKRLDGTPSVTWVSPGPAVPVRTELHDLDLDGRNDLLMGALPSPAQLSWRSSNAVPPEVTLTIPDDSDTITVGTVIPLDPGWGWPLDGAFYSGPGVYDNVFYSGIAGLGDIPITYHYLSFNTQDLCGGSATDTIHVQEMTGMDERGAPHLALSPDPADDGLVITSPVERIGSLWIMDPQGRRLSAPTTQLDGQGHQIQVMTASLPTGAYIAQVRTDSGKRLSVRFLVAHGRD